MTHLKTTFKKYWTKFTRNAVKYSFEAVVIAILIGGLGLNQYSTLQNRKILNSLVEVSASVSRNSTAVDGLQQQAQELRIAVERLDAKVDVLLALKK